MSELAIRRPLFAFEPQGAWLQSLCGSYSQPEICMAGQQDKLREDAQFRILRLLHENPEMSQRELAKAVGISAGGVHYVINALVAKGLIKLGNFTAAKDKRRYAYILTPKGIAAKADLTRRFLERKIAEYEALRAEIEEISAEFDDADFNTKPNLHT